MTHVIAVAAPMGAGKSSLVKAIAERLVDAGTLYFDSYERVTEKSAEEMLDMVRAGADLDDLLVPRLAQDLERLKQGHSVFDPATNREIIPRKYLIFEMPLGREHKGTSGYIDLLIWLDTPFDIALARKLKEFTAVFLARRETEHDRESLLWLDQYLEHYLKFTRQMLEIQQKRVSVSADIILDGGQDPETLAQRATEEILIRIP